MRVFYLPLGIAVHESSTVQCNFEDSLKIKIHASEPQTEIGIWNIPSDHINTLKPTRLIPTYLLSVTKL